MKGIAAILLVSLLLLTACGGQTSKAGNRLIVKAPEKARVSESVIIKVTDENGHPVFGARFYHGYVGGTGTTDKNGEVVTFFTQPGTFEYSVMKSGFTEAKGTVEIGPGVVELIAFGGIHVGPPPAPGQPAQTNSYRPGMMVRFMVTNVGTEEITLSNSAPWEIRTLDNEVVFQPVALQVIVSLAPGGTKEWSWEQKDNNGSQVKEGTYLIVFRCSEGEYRCLFSIVPAALQ